MIRCSVLAASTKHPEATPLFEASCSACTARDLFCEKAVRTYELMALARLGYDFSGRFRTEARA